MIDYYGGKERFLYGRNHDEIKDNFCMANHIQLLRIPYIYDVNNDKEKITKIIEDFIYDDIVSGEIKEFYKSEGRTSYISLLSKMSNENKILVA